MSEAPKTTRELPTPAGLADLSRSLRRLADHHTYRAVKATPRGNSKWPGFFHARVDEEWRKNMRTLCGKRITDTWSDEVSSVGEAQPANEDTVECKACLRALSALAPKKE